MTLDEVPSPRAAQDRRRLTRFDTSCLSSIAYGTHDRASGRVLDVSWGGLGLRVDRHEHPHFETLLERNVLGPLRLGIVDSRWGVFRARAQVVRAQLEARRIRLGLEVHWADPHFYDFVRALGSARARLY